MANREFIVDFKESAEALKAQIALESSKWSNVDYETLYKKLLLDNARLARENAELFAIIKAIQDEDEKILIAENQKRGAIEIRKCAERRKEELLLAAENIVNNQRKSGKN